MFCPVLVLSRHAGERQARNPGVCRSTDLLFGELRATYKDTGKPEMRWKDWLCAMPGREPEGALHQTRGLDNRCPDNRAGGKLFADTDFGDRS